MPESGHVTAIGGSKRELALFAGAGGGLLGSALRGHRPVCAVEINPYARGVLLARQADGSLPMFPIWDDVRTFDGIPWRGHVDVLSGGFPCQDVSPGGGRAGLSGERSGLWFEMARIIGEVRPSAVLIENSADLRSRGLSTVLGDLAGMGYDAKWGTFSACSTGHTHTRRRMFILAHPNGVVVDKGDWNPEAFTADWALSAFDRAPGTRALVRARLQNPSELYGGADGVAERVDRLRAIGNGQVPEMVCAAWSALG